MFAHAMRTLDRQFLKPTRLLFPSHQMLSASQKNDEPVVQFSGILKRLVEDSECTSLTVQAHKNYLIREALMPGLRSNDIRERLLKLEDYKVDIDSSLSLDRLHVLSELSSDISKSFRSAESSAVAAAKPATTSSTWHLRCPIGFERASSSLSVLRSKTAPTFKVPSQTGQLSQKLQSRTLGVCM